MTTARPLPAIFIDAIARADSAGWHARGLCVGGDPEMWFPPDNDFRDAYAICRICPVAGPCLDEAIATEGRGLRYGMRGGKSPEQRRRIAKKRAKEAS